jgi:hypothetical protein
MTQTCVLDCGNMAFSGRAGYRWRLIVDGRRIEAAFRDFSSYWRSGLVPRAPTGNSRARCQIGRLLKITPAGRRVPMDAYRSRVPLRDAGIAFGTWARADVPLRAPCLGGEATGA